jgi:hypothetical protein
VARMCVALDPRWLGPFQRTCGKADPHAAVDLGDDRTLPHQWAERTRRRLDYRDAVTNLGDSRVKAELPDCAAEPFGTFAERVRRSQTNRS